MKRKRLFIGWAPHNRRSQLLAEKLGAELHMLSRLKHRSPLHAPLKYPWLALDTWRLLKKARPEIVFVQNPPPLLPLVIWLFSQRYPLALVIDHHTAAFGRAWFWLLPAQKFLARWARLNIVTNDRWQALIESWGGKAMILDDVPAQFPTGAPYPLQGQANIAVVSSFAPDEPLETVVTAAANLPNVHFYITGDSKRASKSLLMKAPVNVTFTGFLPDSDYFGLLRSVDAVMALTTRNHTNQRGGCEAVWLGKPLITSDWPVLRHAFHSGAVHVPNTAQGIAAGVREALARNDELVAGMYRLQTERRAKWAEVSARLTVLLDKNAQSTTPMKPRYIFIVGLPRTGTKLVRNILQSSRHVHCKISPETFFMGHLVSPGVRYEIKKIGDMSKDSNIHSLVDYMYSGRFLGTYWKHLKNGSMGVDKKTLLQELLNSNRTDKDIYQILLRVHTRVTDDTILGDKTPGHLYHVPDLIEWFPEAKIVHTFRDPRAVLASEWRKKLKHRPTTFPSNVANPLYSFMIVLRITITWLYAVKLHYRYEKHYPENYYLLKFEDLVNDPENNVRELCKFLHIEFDSRMLNPRRSDSSYSRDEGTGFDRQALTRWQSHLKPWMNAWLLLWGKKYLKEFGYIH